MWMVEKWSLKQDKKWGGHSMISRSEEALRVLWKALVTSAIPMTSWHVAAK